jgi:acyl carrier protein
MNSQEQEAIRIFIANRIAKRKEHRQFRDEDDIISSGIIDSLGIMHLVGFLETTFGIRIRDDDLLPENFTSVAAIASFVARSR